MKISIKASRAMNTVLIGFIVIRKKNAFERRAKNQRIITVFNLSDKRQSYKSKAVSCEYLSLLISSDEIYGGKSTV